MHVVIRELRMILYYNMSKFALYFPRAFLRVGFDANEYTQRLMAQQI